jgi:iron complex transport system ATP-binding protein
MLKALATTGLEAKLGADRTLFRLPRFNWSYGKLIAIVGKNGAGKSTFFKHLVGEPSLPIVGQVNLIADSVEQPFQLLENKFSNGVLAWLPQHKIANFDATVLQIVLSGYYRHKPFWVSFSEEDLQNATFLLTKYNIQHLAPQSFNDLSGGEQQLVWLAQTEAQDAEIIILDEPTQQLDLYNKKNVMEVLRKWSNAGKLVLFSTHDIYLIPRYADQILFFNGISSRLLDPSEATIDQLTNLLETAPS